MNGSVFQCYEEQDDCRQYAKTLDVLKSHLKKSMKYAEDLAPLFADPMAQPKISLPKEIDKTATSMEKMIHAEEVKDYVKRARMLLRPLPYMSRAFWLTVSRVSSEMRL